MGSIVLITVDTPASRCLAKAIVANRLHLAGILIEKPRVPAATHADGGIKAKARGLVPAALWKRISAWKWHLGAPRWRRELARVESELSQRADDALAEHLRSEFAALGGSASWPEGIARQTVSDINSDKSLAFLEPLQPDLIAVQQSSILKPRIFELPRLGTLNAHPSLLPAYRGSMVEYWQVYNDDLGKAGITFHFIEGSVDTGDIVFQKGFDRDSKPDPYLLRAWNIMDIIQHYPAVLRSVLNGSAERRPQGAAPDRTYRLADMTPEKRRELFARFSQLRTASVDAPACG